MFINADQIFEQNGTINLIETTDLKTAIEPHWDLMRAEYTAVKTTEGRIIISIVNSIITQKRAVFVLTRNWAQCLVKNDVNHALNSGISNTKWGLFLRSLYNKGHIKQISPGVGRQPAVYQVINKNVLAVLNNLGVDIATQTKEALAFVERKDCNFEPEEVEDETAAATIVPEVEDKLPPSEAAVAPESTPEAPAPEPVPPETNFDKEERIAKVNTSKTRLELIEENKDVILTPTEIDSIPLLKSNPCPRGWTVLNNLPNCFGKIDAIPLTCDPCIFNHHLVQLDENGKVIFTETLQKTRQMTWDTYLLGDAIEKVKHVKKNGRFSVVKSTAELWSESVLNSEVEVVLDNVIAIGL